MDQLDRLRVALAGRYEVDREIGRGGMACVYRARDRQHGRDVAVKLLRPELAATLGTERFLREIRIEAGLQHPHILPLHDSGDADGLPYYVMPFVEGETLRERIRREGPLPVTDAVRIAREVADALSYAHGRGVVHRDIKPANILLSGGHAVVADFGVARAIRSAGEEVLTDAGLAVGTPEYMSPEQGSGDTHVDGRSDIYALGCVLYEMLAGEPPFTGRTAQAVMARHRQDPPPSLAVVRPTLPPTLQATIEMALAKVPADRYPTALEFSDALARTSGAQATMSLPFPIPLVRPRRDWRRIVAAAGVTAVAAIGVWRLTSDPAGLADPNKVMVFPLSEHGAGARADEVGEQIAIMLGSALEHTEPLKWIDGWTRMDRAQREDPRGLTGQAEAALSRTQRAGYFIDGSVIRAGDSATVVIRLHDAGADSVVTQASATGSGSSIALPQLGLKALTGVLPALLEPGRAVDAGALAALADRRPAAIVSWLQGEREYRRGHFRQAQAYYERAVEADSDLALAALKGAQAAGWTDREADAERLVEAALRRKDLLPTKYQAFGEGLRHYLAGRADSAVDRFHDALAADGEWGEAWMALGEVSYHLFPSPASATLTADQAFANARRFDPGFAPPLFHLAENALRQGHLDEAERIFTEFARSSPDSLLVMPLSFALGCVRNSWNRTQWDALLRQHPLEVLHAGRLLSVMMAHPRCGALALRAVFEAQDVPLNLRAFAAFGLHDVLIAAGRPREADSLLGRATAAGFPEMEGLAVADAEVGMGVGPRAARAAAQAGANPSEASLLHLWYVAVWASRRRDTATLAAVSQELTRRVAQSPGPSTVLGRSVDARLALARGDTAGALDRLATLTPDARFPQLTWGIWQPLGSERLLRAELLLARGDARGALEAARALDHAGPVSFLVYLRRSVAVRLEALEQLGWGDSAAVYRRRQIALDGWRSSRSLE